MAKNNTMRRVKRAWYTVTQLNWKLIFNGCSLVINIVSVCPLLEQNFLQANERRLHKDRQQIGHGGNPSKASFSLDLSRYSEPLSWRLRACMNAWTASTCFWCSLSALFANSASLFFFKNSFVFTFGSTGFRVPSLFSSVDLIISLEESSYIKQPIVLWLCPPGSVLLHSADGLCPAGKSVNLWK